MGAGPVLLPPPGALPPAPRHRALTTPWLGVVVGALLVGALLARPASILAAGLVVGVGVAVRHPLVLAAGALLVGSILGHRALDGLRDPPVGTVEGRATLVADPEPGRYGTRAEVRLNGRRWQVQADGAAGGQLRAALLGEVISVRGVARAPRAGSGWMVPRHLVGTIRADHLERVAGASWTVRGANRFRRLLADGAAVLAPSTAALFGGFVLGDDRDQPPEIVDDFRATGLTHVLVVSGQNLAYVLVLLGPLLDRLRWRGRWTATVLVIAAFATVTRFEPSVLRASAMAAIAVTGQAVGRPQASLRALVLGVGALVLIDPLLVRSVGFQLSAGASLGILLLGGSIRRALPGPTVVAETLATTVAAQLGVAPILLPIAGGIPVVALVANPLAVPVAGLVTTWGLPAGLVAGLGGPEVAAVAHAPTRVLIGWIAGVARLGARLPLGELRAEHLVALVVLGGAGWLGRGRARCLAVAAMATVLATPAVVLARWHPDDAVLTSSRAHLRHRDGQVIVEVVGAPAPLDLLADLRRAGVVAIDRLVVPEDDPGGTARLLAHRWPIGEVVARPPPR
jgi:competence protein ComEC